MQQRLLSLAAASDTTPIVTALGNSGETHCSERYATSATARSA